MAYEIPYDSNYGEWYGQPQDVTRLSAMLEQSLDEDGYPIGIITASWNMPDNGGTFVAQLSTDGTEYHIAETNIRQNGVILTVEANTDYYLKIITVLGSQQSSGVVSSLLSSGVTIVPPTPTVVAVQGGMQINVGSVPFGYSVAISISDGTDTTVLYTTNMITIYNCDAGTYTVSTAYANASNDVGTSSSSVSVTVSELATADDYVEKTSADYIKSASVNTGGDTLTLTKGDDTTVTFQGGGGYVLPIASSSTLGGIKVGNNLSIDANGVLSATGGGSGSGVTYDLLWESSSANGDYSVTISLDNKNILDYAEVCAEITYKKRSWGTFNSFYIPVVELVKNGDSASEIIVIPRSNGSSISIPTLLYSQQNNALVFSGNNQTNDFGLIRVYGVKYGGGSGGGSYTAGNGIDISNDTISLETASANDIGGVKVGTNLSIDANGVLSATDTTYTDFVGSGATASSGLVPAPPTTAGTTKYLREDGSWSVPSGGGGGGGSYTAGDGIDITNDTISLETASTTDIGGVIVGSGLSIDANGVLSAISGGGVQEEEIWSGTLTSGYATLSKPITDYDFIVIYYRGASWGSSTVDSIPYVYPSKSLAEKISTGSASFYGYEREYCGFTVTSATQITAGNRNNLYICKIDGIKIGGGGGGITARCGSYTHNSSISNGQEAQINIAFDSPMADTNYYVSICRTDTVADYGISARYKAINKTTNGFTLVLYADGHNVGAGYSVDWMAIHP